MVRLPVRPIDTPPAYRRVCETPIALLFAPRVVPAISPVEITMTNMELCTFHPGIAGRQRHFFLFLPFCVAIAVLSACGDYLSTIWYGPDFESLPAFHSFLKCVDTSAPIACFAAVRDPLLRQCRHLLSRTGHTQFHRCLSQLHQTQTEIQWAVSVQQCFYLAKIRDLEPRLSWPYFWLVVLVVLSQAFSVACASFVSRAHKQLVNALNSEAHHRINTVGQAKLKKPVKDAENGSPERPPSSERDKSTTAITMETPRCGPGAFRPDLLVARAWRDLSRHAVVGPRTNSGTRSWAQNLHMPTVITPLFGAAEVVLRPAPAINENLKKPSFNISTPEGRFQMKQYLSKLLKRKPGNIHQTCSSCTERNAEPLSYAPAK